MPALAQAPQPGPSAAQFVAHVSEAFFDILPSSDYPKGRAFFDPELAEVLTDEKWRALGGKIANEAGAMPRYHAHGLHFYPQGDRLLAAVDFSGDGTGGAVVCGYLLWSMPTPDVIGLARIEQNIVVPDAFRSMDSEEAAATLEDWRCPTSVIDEMMARIGS